jgi:hypothetical protein
MTYSSGSINLPNWFTELSKTLINYPFSTKEITKDTDEQQMEEMHRTRQK